MSRFQLTALSLAVALGACGPAASRPSAELPALDGQFEEALNTGDIDALVALYAEDARIMPPNTELMQGHEQIAAMFGEMIEGGFKLQLESMEAVVAGDIGYQVGTYTLQGPDGATVDRGKYIEVWRQVDGVWKMINDIWNSDMPAAAGETTLIITHQVMDAERWLAAWQGPDSRHEMFTEHGVTGVRVFQSRQNPNLTGLLVGVADMEGFQDFLASPEAAAAKAQDGVVDATLRVFTEVR